MSFWNLVAELGMPIAATVGLGAFIMVIIKYILGSVVSSINFIESVITQLDNRVKTMNNDMIKLDTAVSAALSLKPDLNRIARAENFVEDGTIDVRRD